MNESSRNSNERHGLLGETAMRPRERMNEQVRKRKGRGAYKGRDESPYRILEILEEAAATAEQQAI